ncbi:fused DSP-PTPase phosphatase/NAD kinase-like protein [Clostridium gasigenes]|uniref:fused DSP-PTPase phosphatase/NAD kinase-like protein n=1 Tax=Clostridium gasigenes TaxID=94869 RepID=UPI001C0B4023|nr:phosphatase [Clostridium gasigenes]MBU3108225.1 phosphatase [Clostridium gasigenes]
MKNYNKIFTSLLLSIFLFLSITINANASASLGFVTTQTLNENPADSQTLIRRDNNSKTPLPNRFRNLKDLNISGSAQFNPSQLKNIIETLNNNELYIIDLRQESHGFINTTPINFYNREKLLNKDFTTSDTLVAEKKDLDSIKIGSEVNISNKDGKVIDTITAEKVFSEETLVKENNVFYERFAVRDGGIPTLEVTDDFVDFVKNKTPNSHLHFHCKAGQGRTTTFMSLYQMMNNKDNLPLDAILKHQLDEGGVILTDSSSRAAFLESFYKYTLENMDSNFKVPYSTWIKSN